MPELTRQKIKLVTLVCWADPADGLWAWQLQCGAHSKTQTGQVLDAPGSEVARTCLINALSQLKRPCILEIFQYPNVLAGQPLPLPSQLHAGDITVYYTNDDQSPTMQHLASIARHY